MEKLILYLIRLIAILTLIWVIFGCGDIDGPKEVRWSGPDFNVIYDTTIVPDTTVLVLSDSLTTCDTLAWGTEDVLTITDSSYDDDIEWLPHDELRVNAESFNKIVIYNFEDCEIIMEEK